MQPNTNINNKFESKVTSTQIPLELRGLVSEGDWSTYTYEQKDLLINIDTIPTSILGTLPEDVWTTLTHKQRLEVLISYKLLPRVSTEGDGLSTEIEGSERSTMEANEDQVGTQEVKDIENIATVENLDPIKSEFESVKERIRDIESDTEVTEAKESDLEGRVSEIITDPSGSQDPSFDVPSVPKFTGYQPSKDLLADIETHVNGDPVKGKTWTANIINKIWLALVSHDE